LNSPATKVTAQQRQVRECRKQLIDAVARRNAIHAARTAALLYQLTHPPLAPSVKVKLEMTAISGLDEDDLPLSELMKLHPLPMKIKKEDAPAEAADIAASEPFKRKRKRNSKQLQGSSSDDDGGTAVKHNASSARTVRHSQATIHDQQLFGRLG
jgi:hypothetical protein